MPPEAALEPFDRAIALDSAFAPAYIHPVEIALERQDPEAARRYIDGYLASDPTDMHAGGERLVRLLLDSPVSSEQTQQVLDTASANALSPAMLAFWWYPDSTEWGLRLARRLAEGRPGNPPWDDPEMGRGFEIMQAISRGRVREAAGLLPPGDYNSLEAIGFLNLALLGAVPADSVSARVQRWIRRGGPGVIF